MLCELAKGEASAWFLLRRQVRQGTCVQVQGQPFVAGATDHRPAAPHSLFSGSIIALSLWQPSRNSFLVPSVTEPAKLCNIWSFYKRTHILGGQRELKSPEIHFRLHSLIFEGLLLYSLEIHLHASEHNTCKHQFENIQIPEAISPGTARPANTGPAPSPRLPFLLFLAQRGQCPGSGKGREGPQGSPLAFPGPSTLVLRPSEALFLGLSQLESPVLRAAIC